MAKILIIDDEREITVMLAAALFGDDYDVTTTSAPERGLELLKQEPFDIVITDLHMPGIDGLEVLRRAKTIRPGVEVVLITAYATVETARQALKHGALDYLTKPFSVENELRPLIRRIIDAQVDADDDGLEDDADTSASGAEGPEPGPTAGSSSTRSQESLIIAVSTAMRRVIDVARRVAASDANILLRGESGTGKEVLASLIHRGSSRRDRPFVKVNCAALPDTLLESELFGHTRGAFTGAVADRLGFFDAADGGTIFLDEIGEVSQLFQPKLLRVLESGEFHRIGEAQRTTRVDVRVIAATNRNLEEAIRHGDFREDLYYRLNVVPIAIPPLRERPEDIPALLDHFRELHGGGRTFSREAWNALIRYDWPGNVRELMNAVEHAIVLGEGHEIQLQDLPVPVQQDQSRGDEVAGGGANHIGTLESIEIRCIMQAMAKTGFNRTRAADLLGISRRTLGYRIEKYALAGEIDAARRKTGRGRSGRRKPPYSGAGPT